MGWCVLATVGGDYKCQTRFAEITGLSQSAISYYLNGHNKIPLDVAEEINAAVAKYLGTTLIGMFSFYHPFEIGAGGTWRVPGDPEWGPWWNTFRTVAPGEPAAEELIGRFPDLFP
jgi:transcriptional regulator with XRE-family HTH domain